MAKIAQSTVQERLAVREFVASLQEKRIFTWQRLALAAIILLSTILEFFQLNQEGYANTYYAAGIKSMLTSWHNFFFISSDAGGFVALDKPPLGFWIQAASAWLFGFSGFSMLLPEALAGVLSVILLYFLVARSFGSAAGLLAAVILAVTPITVVTDRNNTIDSLLILTLLLAVWAVSYACETGRLRWLLLGALAVGLGFNIKMLQAYLIVPALSLMYLSGAPGRWRTRIWHLILAGVILLLVSLSWATTVDLTPAAARPFVSDSGTNSELSLILGYNGLGRMISSIGVLHIFNSTIDLNVMPAFAPNIGDPGLFRLFNQNLGGQASWFLALAVMGLLIAFIRFRPHFPLHRRGQATVLWGGWLITAGIYFSVSRFFHPYYLVMLAPPIAAMVGIGVVMAWEDYRRPGWRGWLLPITMLVTATTQVMILVNFPNLSSWLTPLIVGVCTIAMLICIVARLRHFKRSGTIASIVVMTLLVLLLSPFVWDIISLQNNAGSTWLPVAGPNQGFAQAGNGGGFGARGSFTGRQPGNFPGGGSPANGGFGGRAGGGGNAGGQALTYAGPDWDTLDPKLVSYLTTHEGQTHYLVATSTSSYASVFILATNKPALALGGYQGWDSIVTPAQLAQLVKQNVVRFFYLSANQPQTGGQAFSGSTSLANVNNDLIQWVQSSCGSVSANLWQTTSSTSAPGIGNFGAGRGQQLYDCAAHP